MAGITPDAEQQLLLDAQKETAQAIAWWTNIIILVSFGLLLLAFTPDSLVISDNAATEMPFIGSASIKLVLISGPLVLLLLRMFLSSYLSHWNRLERQIGHLKPAQEKTLTLMQNRRLRRWAGFVHFPMIAIVLIATTWRGLGFPLWGEFMALLTIIVVLWLTFRTFLSRRWFNLTVLLGIIAATAAAVPIELMEYDRALNDPDGNNYTGSLLWVACSSPNGAGSPKKAKKRLGCIGNELRNASAEDIRKRVNRERRHTRQEKRSQTRWQRTKTDMNSLLSIVNRFFVVRRQLDLSGADMERADLRFLNLQWASFTHANLPYALFNGAKVQNATFSYAILVRANFAYAKMRDARLRRTNLHRARFWRAQMQNADFHAADLTDSMLMRANLTEADLSRAKLWNANLRGVRSIGAVFREADLTEANLQNANLSNSKMQRAILRAADLSGANLKNANLTNSDLQGAAFVGVSRRTRELQVADLSGADLRCANLKGTNLNLVKGLKREQLSCACMDAATELPDGWNFPKTCHAKCKNVQSGDVLICSGPP